ncbi:MAG: hypothetical protein NC339_07615 [Muribaculaceae bacterium]|nr:hypothetical protein [Muribaculaceae bacterium]
MPINVKALVALAFLLSALHAAAGLRTERHYHYTPVAVADTLVTLGDLPGHVCMVETRVSLDDLRERRGYSKGSYGLKINPEHGTDTISLTLRWGNTDFGDITDSRFTELKVEMGGSEIESRRVEGFVGKSGSYSTLGARLRDGRLTVYGGSRSTSELFEMQLPSGFVSNSVSLRVHGSTTVSIFVAETELDPAEMLSTDWAKSLLDGRFACTSNPVEGYWEYLDRQNDPTLARPGGRYTLALVANDDGGYDILYVSGAEILASRWEPFMLKGRLKPTNFQNHYSLEWIDAEFEEINTDVHADIADGAILSLSFPLLKTVLRFSKARF